MVIQLIPEPPASLNHGGLKSMKETMDANEGSAIIDVPAHNSWHKVEPGITTLFKPFPPVSINYAELFPHRIQVLISLPRQSLPIAEIFFIFGQDKWGQVTKILRLFCIR